MEAVGDVVIQWKLFDIPVALNHTKSATNLNRSLAKQLSAGKVILPACLASRVLGRRVGELSGSFWDSAY